MRAVPGLEVREMPEEMGKDQRAPAGSGMSRLAVPSLAQRLPARSVPLSRTKTSQGALLSSPPASAPILSTTCSSPRLARKLCNQLPPAVRARGAENTRRNGDNCIPGQRCPPPRTLPDDERPSSCRLFWPALRTIHGAGRGDHVLSPAPLREGNEFL